MTLSQQENDSRHHQDSWFRRDLRMNWTEIKGTKWLSPERNRESETGGRTKVETHVSPMEASRREEFWERKSKLSYRIFAFLSPRLPYRRKEHRLKSNGSHLWHDGNRGWWWGTSGFRVTMKREGNYNQRIGSHWIQITKKLVTDSGEDKDPESGNGILSHHNETAFATLSQLGFYSRRVLHPNSFTSILTLPACNPGSIN